MNTYSRGGSRTHRAGFTLVEVLIATALAGVALTASLIALSSGLRMWNSTDREMDGSGEALLALQKMVSGVGTNPGLRMAIWDPTVPTPTITSAFGGPSHIVYKYGTNNYSYALQNTGQILDGSGNVICGSVDSVSFSFETAMPGTIKVDLVVRRIGAPSADQMFRLVSWVACRNRTRSL